MLEIYAGNKALNTIKEEGFSQELFTTFLGASGGPKWFTLFGLDKYLFGTFFKGRKAPLNIMGSSAGAFRAACFGQNDPVAAIERLAEHYSQTVYSSNKPTPKEITQKAREILDLMLGTHGVDEIISNPVFRSHFVVAKCNGLVSKENKAAQLIGLLNSMIRNRFKRSLLRNQYERFIYQPKHSDLTLSDPDDFSTTTEHFTPANIKDALLASGSIPLVMEGIENIAGSPNGMYRDGGIVDYHFDLKIHNPGLTLYPHFSASLKAGWFDKNLKRNVRAENYDNIVVLCPSKEFVDSLPYQKIPDRTDFTDLPADERIRCWQQVFKQSEILADCFEQFVEQPQINTIKPMKALIHN